MNVKPLASAIAATLLLVGAAEASNLISDPTFSVYGTTALSDSGVGSYFQSNILSDWTTPDSTTSFLYLNGQGNGNINQNGGSCSTPGSTNNCFALWNSTNGGHGSVLTGAPTGNIIVADADSTYHQSFSTTVSGLTVGQTYHLTFYQNAGQQNGYGSLGNSINAYWQVTFGSSTEDAASMTAAYQRLAGWEEETLTFTATAVSETLTFLAESTSTGSVPPFALLGDVSLVSTAPEPVSFGIMGLGFLVLGLAARKRIKNRANRN